MTGSKNIRFNQANSGEVTSIRVQQIRHPTDRVGTETVIMGNHLMKPFCVHRST